MRKRTRADSRLWWQTDQSDAVAVPFGAVVRLGDEQARPLAKAQRFKREGTRHPHIDVRCTAPGRRRRRERVQRSRQGAPVARIGAMAAALLETGSQDGDL